MSKIRRCDVCGKIDKDVNSLWIQFQEGILRYLHKDLDGRSSWCEFSVNGKDFCSIKCLARYIDKDSV